MKLSHMTFIVRDLSRSTEIFTEIFAAKEVYSSKEKQYSLFPEKFFLIDDLWVALMEDQQVKLPKTYNHIAFEIAPEQIPLYKEKLYQLDLKIEEGRSRVSGEGESIYFYDDDDHLFELHAGNLADRLKKYEE
ncbi:FosX/FosE/FosI family fosfomycin resistance hydrolase [Enterococcus sp. DIV1298c]|uniref:Fosfomycin resistance protein FosX n=1 Tax=Candidatus Enterococcus mangumiae TaxID=2230878 RepID=A0ABZ2SYR4_9ENTE|nr:MULTISPECIES: FosX/FosE/FosI family fosfomycin resistance hydrolase [unclassified Enterococcus]MBO0460463.1 FosX/FosE/FosI family fosfomycin resistance hydrolase [Enterococcus sp. DIV1298c]MBO0490700.1 FosX/FosE/FosI family fosfomycin resistance hydrolase [Enterococcus sp. DIV1094]